jgi:hypothetical protein
MTASNEFDARRRLLLVQSVQPSAQFSNLAAQVGDYGGVFLVHAGFGAAEFLAGNLGECGYCGYRGFASAESSCSAISVSRRSPFRRP